MPEMTSIEKLPQPTMVIDTARPEIREANASARLLWGLRGSIDLPVPLDPAMPALKHLTQRLQIGMNQETAALVFWTWAGAQLLRCSFQQSNDAGAVLVAFENDTSSIPPDSASKEPDQAPHSPPVSDSIDVHAMAHELRTPIGAIIALAEMIETEQFGTIGDPRYREYARDIGDSARLSLSIVAGSLQQNTSDPDLLHNFTELNLAELIQKCLRTVHQSALEAKVNLRQIVPGDLPHLIASGPGLTQILLNLLTNAVKFTPAGGTVTVQATATTEGGVRMSVRDTGVGMTVIDANVLIAGDPPNSTSSSASSAEKTAPLRPGIGFSLVRRLADAMTAKFEITSTRGVGTHASLTFPPGKAIPTTTARSTSE